MFNGVTPLNLDATFRVDDFSYRELFNPSSYAKVRGDTLQTEAEWKYGAKYQTPCLMGRASNSALNKSLNRKNVNT